MVVQTNDMDIFAAVAHRSADGSDGGRGSEGESGLDIGVIGSSDRHKGVERSASTGESFVILVGKVSSCIIQLIDRLYWHNHEYPKMAEADRSRWVSRNVIS